MECPGIADVDVTHRDSLAIGATGQATYYLDQPGVAACERTPHREANRTERQRRDLEPAFGVARRRPRVARHHAHAGDRNQHTAGDLTLDDSARYRDPVGVGRDVRERPQARRPHEDDYAEWNPHPHDRERAVGIRETQREQPMERFPEPISKPSPLTANVARYYPTDVAELDHPRGVFAAPDLRDADDLLALDPFAEAAASTARANANTARTVLTFRAVPSRPSGSLSLLAPMPAG